MGIVRYAVKCPGCDAGITLRLGVGHERRQPFFLVCPRCEAVTRGTHVLNDDDLTTSLDLHDGERLDSDEGCIATISVNPEFPSVPNAKG